VIGVPEGSLHVPGLRTDEPFGVQFEWLSTWGLAGAVERYARVAQVRLGEHDGFYLINRRIKATFEHPFLVRRDDEWGFCSAELLKIGDCLITPEGEERIDHLEWLEGRVRTVSLYVPGTNIYLADGVWTHNTLASGSSSSGSASASGSGSASGSASGSSGSKSSGSSFSSSSASATIGVSTSGGSGSSSQSASGSSSGGGPGIG